MREVKTNQKPFELIANLPVVNLEAVFALFSYQELVKIRSISKAIKKEIEKFQFKSELLKWDNVDKDLKDKKDEKLKQIYHANVASFFWYLHSKNPSLGHLYFSENKEIASIQDKLIKIVKINETKKKRRDLKITDLSMREVQLLFEMHRLEGISIKACKGSFYEEIFEPNPTVAKKFLDTPYLRDSLLPEELEPSASIPRYWRVIAPPFSLLIGLILAVIIDAGFLSIFLTYVLLPPVFSICWLAGRCCCNNSQPILKEFREGVSFVLKFAAYTLFWIIAQPVVIVAMLYVALCAAINGFKSGYPSVGCETGLAVAIHFTQAAQNHSVAGFFKIFKYPSRWCVNPKLTIFDVAQMVQDETRAQQKVNLQLRDVPDLKVSEKIPLLASVTEEKCDAVQLTQVLVN